jgi:hypothetical protein
VRIKSTLATAIAIGLLAGSAVAVAAQDAEAERMPPTAFTGRLVCSDEVPVLAGEQSEEQFASGITLEKLGTPTWSMKVEDASDPRLDGDGTFALNGDGYWEGVVGDTADVSLVDVMVGAIRIRNDAGAWQGVTYLVNVGDEPQFDADVVLLVGSGGYTGLVAMTEMRQRTNICDWDLRGVIVEGDLPLIPEVSAE